MQHLTRSLKDGSSLVYVWFDAMHTRIDIMLWDPVMSPEDMLAVAAAIRGDVIRIEEMGSCFIPDSEVSAINSSLPGVPVRVSEELYRILYGCLEYNDRTEGLFDVTASPLLPGVKMQDKIRLEPDGSVTRIHEAARINLSGFLKGYALDRAVKEARRNDLRNGLVSFGNSSVGAFGNHPNGEGWPVASVDIPGKNHLLKDSFLTTSGNADENRKHIINPWNGQFIEGKGMVSVITGTAEEGEVMSTVAFIRKNIETNNTRI